MRTGLAVCINLTARSIVSANWASSWLALPSLTQPLPCRTNALGIPSATTVARVMLSGACRSTPFASA